MGKIKGSLKEVRHLLIDQQNAYHYKQAKLPWLKKVTLVDKLNEMEIIWKLPIK